MPSNIGAVGRPRSSTSMPAPRPRDEELRALWQEKGGRIIDIAKTMGLTQGQVSGRSRLLGLQFHSGRAIILDPAHPNAVDGHSIFHRHTVEPAPAGGVLKSGDNQRKLGRIVTKGAWKGMPIYSLTLEERASCPRACKQWLNCYGNNMGRSKRYRHGELLLIALAEDFSRLAVEHPDGYVVRLHILGDFWSTDYVKFWRVALDTFPQLHVFGYTAWQRGTPIGNAVASLRDARWDQFAVRTSGAPEGPRTLVVGEGKRLPKAIVCPAQTGKTMNCGTCGLCWSDAAKHRPIAFLQH